MKINILKTGSYYCLIYIIAYIASLVYAILFIDKSGLAAIYITILTFPWSYITIAILFVLDIIDDISINTKLLVFTLYAGINASGIYLIGYKRKKGVFNTKVK